MIPLRVRELPTPEETTTAAFGRMWRVIARENLVLRGSGAGVAFPRRTSGLSAKFAWGGEEHYPFPGPPWYGRALVADDEAWAVVGADEEHESRIAPGRVVGTIGVYFAADFVAAVRAERWTRDERLLDAEGVEHVAERVRGAPLPLGARRLPYDPLLTSLLRATWDAPEDDVVHPELLHAALARVLDRAAAAPAEWDRLPCVRASTRAEIHRRLCHARDLLESAYAERLDVPRLARAASMAPHHFLHRFRELFGATPHQMLVARRLSRARWMLEHTDEPIGSIARAVGFESFGSFSARFRRSVGAPPLAYRRLTRTARSWRSRP